MESVRLILIGGAEDKTDKLEILSKVAECANFKNIVLIPTASSYPLEAERNYKEVFEKLNVQNFKTLDIRYPEECDKSEFIDAVLEANMIFFSGGDQVKLVNTLKDSKLLKVIKEKFFTDKLKIAGTSAGAASASVHMIYDGDYRGFLKGMVNVDRGFGFIDDVIIDTHFLNRERIPRLLQLLARGVEKKAIGLDEDTAIFIDNNYNFEVHGSGMITLLNSEEMTYNDFHEVAEKQTYNINNVKLGFLSRGAKFSLKNWTVLKPQKAVLSEQAFIYDINLISPGINL